MRQKKMIIAALAAMLMAVTPAFAQEKDNGEHPLHVYR